VAQLERGLSLLPREDRLRPDWERLLKECRRWRDLEARLPALLQGKDRPRDAAETIEFAQLCAWAHRRQYASASRLYAEAFRADPARADNLVTGDRYYAACAAAQAGCGLGTDALPDDRKRTAWREQALAWLRADLTLREKQAKSSDLKQREDVRINLPHWKRDDRLACVRDPAALARLPKAEQAAWHKLWADVQELLDRVGADR
jgi:hypothetical protein